MTTQDSPESMFDLDVANSENLPGRPLDDGEAVELDNTVVAVPGPDWAPSDKPDWTPDQLFDAGVPAPLSGATYEMGVLSTPNAVVSDQSVNPLMQLSFEEILTNDATRQLLIRAGITDADDFEWRKGPTEIGDVPDGTEFADVPDGTEFSDSPDGTTVHILDETAETKAYAGVVEGDNSWLVVVDLARAEYDDFAVITAGIQRSPVGSGATSDVPDGTEFDTTGNDPFLSWVGNGALMSILAWGELESQ